VLDTGEYGRRSFGPEGSSGGAAGVTIAHNRSVEERRQVTALFADVSGFTSLAGRLDTEELLAVVDPVIMGLAEIVDRYDGYLEKFAGDALLALFGAPVAHEDDAVRALRVAAEMHASIAELSTSPAASELSLHVGVNTGVVVARSIEARGLAQYAVLGESVILAQRLESLAPPGQTYVGRLTMELATESFHFEDLGAREVKGRADPVEVYRVTGRRAAVPAPATRELIGRENELAILLDTLRTARTGSSRVARLTGPVGSGKSRLVAELRGHPAAEGARWVEIVGEPYTQAAYGSLTPLFTAALEHRYPDETSIVERLRRLSRDPAAPAPAAYTAVLVGERTGDDALGDRVAPEIRRQVHAAAAAWLADLAGRRDLVVAVDNAQWLEPSSAQLLRELTSSVPTAGVLFCLSGRDQAKPPDDPATGIVVEMRPLRPVDVAELIVDELAWQPDERLTAFVHDRSQGNPLMARETVRHLREDNLLDARRGHVRLIAGAGANSLPATLETLLAARIDTLRPEVIRLATAAAAIGHVVPVLLLAAVSGEDDESMDMHIAELIDAGFVVRQDGSLRFDSPLVRDVLYARLTGRRRQALHTRIADVIHGTVSSTDAAAALMAEHRFLAGDPSGALPWLCKVAEHSRLVFAQDDAVIALVRAVESARALSPRRAELVGGLLCDLADVRMDLGEYDLAAELYVSAQRECRDGRAFAGLGAALRRQGHYAEAQAQLDAALGAAPTGDLRLIWRELSAVRSVSGDLRGSRTAAQAGLNLGGTQDRVAGHLLSQLVRAETLLGEFDAAREHVDQAIDNLERAGDLTGLCTALRLLGSLQESTGLLDEAAGTLERGLDLAERTGLVEEIGGCLINLGLVNGARDDHRAAADCYARAAVTFERTDNRAGVAVAWGNRAYELFMLGDTDEARALGARAVRLAEAVGNHFFAADVHHTLGLIAESVGDRATALSEAQAAIDEFDRAEMPEAAGPSRELASRSAGGPDPDPPAAADG
jgi:class 3 adenylate cyclase/tetratricopeptide (TPR) repeat protein